MCPPAPPCAWRATVWHFATANGSDDRLVRDVNSAGSPNPSARTTATGRNSRHRCCLRDLFPDVVRISARMSANRRDRLTARLPMFSRPHPEGGVGALRIEVRGNDATGGRSTLVVGIAELVGTAAAATAVAFLQAMLAGSLPTGVVCAGDARLDTVSLLRTIERVGVRLQEFTGIPEAQIMASS